VIRVARLEQGDERDLVRQAAQTGQRFLGADPVSETVPRMCRRLRERGASLLALYDEASVLAVAAYAPNPRNGRQADVDLLPLAGAATTDLVEALLDFLHRFERIGSFVKIVEHGDEREQAFRDSGFVEIGRLRAHTFARGRYHDQAVLHRRTEVER
jgi:hypothetical protein